MAQHGWPGIFAINQLDLGAAASAYAAAGIPVFPLWGVQQDTDGGAWRCACPDGQNPDGKKCENPGKHPLVRWTQECSTDPGQIASWWAQWPGANIGVPTGSRSGLLVLDLDLRAAPALVGGKDSGLALVQDGQTELASWLERELGAALDLQELMARTAVQRTGSGGTQVWLVDPGQCKSINGWLPAVDMKADGGYVVAPPSRHISGGRYEWQNEHSPEPVLEVLAGRLRLARGGGGKRADSGQEGGGGDGAGVLSHSEMRDFARTGPPPGRRDDFFNAYAFQLRKNGWEHDAALQEIRRVWEMTPGGGVDGSGGSGAAGAGGEFSWQTAADKVARVWRDVRPDNGSGSLGQELRAWVGAATATRPPEGHGGAARVPDDTIPLEPATDLGNAQRYARLMRDRLRYVAGTGWHELSGAILRPDELGRAQWLAGQVIADIQALAQAPGTGADAAQQWMRWAHASQSSARMTAMVRLAQTHPALAISVRQLDADPWVLCVRLGDRAGGSAVLDLRAWTPGNALGALREGRTQDYCTRMTGAVYDPYADPAVAAPGWLRHVATVAAGADGTLDGGMAAFLQRWAGYSLTGLVHEQKFAFCYGTGNNGKNVLIETMMQVMGDYAIAGSMQLLAGSGQEHETIVADLAGARLVFIDETPRGRVNDSRIKQMTGGKRIKARWIAGNPFEFDARFKLWIAGNHRPRVDDTSLGFWRRLDLIPFEATIAARQRIKDYAAMLFRDEGPGILNWMLEGLAAYREHGLEPPSRVLAAGQQYQQEQDWLAQFAADTFRMNAPEPEWAWCPNPVLHGLLQRWCRDNGMERSIPGSQTLAQEWRRLGFRAGGSARRYKQAWGADRVGKGWAVPPTHSSLPTELTFQPLN